MELYVFYHEPMAGRDADTLYKLKLELPSSLPSISELQQPSPEREELLSPVLELPRDKYPSSMGCVQLDSKLYFFGGVIGPPVELFDYFATEDDLTDQKYPSDVYVFDTNSHSHSPDQGGCGDNVVLNQVASMTTGKPDAFGFVANGMIYVIGGSVTRSYKYSNKSIKRFERFAPGAEKWEVLDDSPLRQIDNCVGATVVEAQHKVLLTAWKDKQSVRIVYDFLHDRWDSEFLTVEPPRCPDFHVYACLNSNNGGGPQFLYGFRCHPLPFPVPMKLGPLTDSKELDQIHKLPIINMSSSALAVDGLFRRIGHHTMLPMGDGHLCYVSTRQICGGVPAYGFHCPHTRNITVIIAKEKEEKEEPNGGFSFDADILCVKQYFINANYHGDVELGGCFIFGSHHQHG